MKKNYIILGMIIFIIVIIATIALGYNGYKKNTVIITQEINQDALSNPIEEQNLIGSIDTDDIKKLNSIIEDEREKLKYDEAINIEFKGKKIVITGVQPLEDVKEIKEYYPTVSVPSVIEEYNFDMALIYENNIGNYYISDEKIVSQEELGRVYKRDLNSNNIKYISLKYSKNNKFMTLNIYIDESSYKEENLDDKYDVELVEENGIEYSILKDKNDNSLKGVYFEVNVDKEVYSISINMMNSINDEASGKEIKEFLKTIDMINFVNQLNITTQENKYKP